MASDHDEALTKARRLLNLQWQQSRTEIWKVVIGAMGAGAVLLTAGVVIGAVLARCFIE